MRKNVGCIPVLAYLPSLQSTSVSVSWLPMSETYEEKAIRLLTLLTQSSEPVSSDETWTLDDIAVMAETINLAPAAWRTATFRPAQAIRQYIKGVCLEPIWRGHPRPKVWQSFPAAA